MQYLYDHVAQLAKTVFTWIYIGLMWVEWPMRDLNGILVLVKILLTVLGIVWTLFQIWEWVTETKMFPGSDQKDN